MSHPNEAQPNAVTLRWSGLLSNTKQVKFTQTSFTKNDNILIYIDGYQTFAFPCNDFGNQEPGSNAEITQFVTEGWPNLNAVLFDKIHVNGDECHPVYVYLKTVFEGDIQWNFATKVCAYLYNRKSATINHSVYHWS